MRLRQLTPLHPVYGKYEAIIQELDGWKLPVQFQAGLWREHEAVRHGAGLFDVSFLGKIRIDGPDALAYLQKLTTNDVAQLEPGMAQFSLMCYRDGGIVDDLLLYRLGAEAYMMAVNASNLSKDLEWLYKHLEERVRVTDISRDLAVLALQGPRAETILQIVTDYPLAELSPNHFVRDVPVGDVTALIARTGYTGEDGFELFVAPGEAIDLWEHLLAVGQEEGLLPAGQGARDTLRFEAGFPCYGRELTYLISPIEAGLAYAVKLEKGEFVGRQVLLEQVRQGPERLIVGFAMKDFGLPQTGSLVLADEREIGAVTSGIPSPGQGIDRGFALVESVYARSGAPIWIETDGRLYAAHVVPLPFRPGRGVR